MPHVPGFPSSDDSERDDDRDRQRDSIIGRIIDDNGFPTPNPG
ncbi:MULTISPECIES: hypothetical protein [Halopiger]|nr:MULTISPECIES: hypothetical protein [Halopiger]